MLEIMPDLASYPKLDFRWHRVFLEYLRQSEKNPLGRINLRGNSSARRAASDIRQGRGLPTNFVFQVERLPDPSQISDEVQRTIFDFRSPRSLFLQKAATLSNDG